MTFIEQTWGTWLNVGTVLLGASLGMLLSGKLPERITKVVMQAIGLVTLLLGITNALDLNRVSEPPGMVVGLLAGEPPRRADPDAVERTLAVLADLATAVAHAPVPHAWVRS